MKRITLTLIVSIFALYAIEAQQITPQVIASSGGYTQNGGYSVSWTLGEPVIATATNSGTTLTQGFQQPSYDVVAITTQTIQDFDVNVFPNPATDYIVIDWTTDKDNTLYITLFDLAGKKISEQTCESSQDKISVNMSQLASSNYLLEVRDKNYQYTKIFRIAKK